MSPAAFDHAIQIVPHRGTGQDRAAVVPFEGGLVVVLADGAGGIGGGEQAAQAVIDAVTAAAPDHDWMMLLAELDHLWIGKGQTTAVVLRLDRDGLAGASAGDSAAWIVHDGAVDDVTQAQRLKPLIGDAAVITPFQRGPLAGGTLLVASDGLFKYAKAADIIRIAAGPDLAAAARALVELVRLPSGQVPDDVSIVLCRETRP